MRIGKMKEFKNNDYLDCKIHFSFDVLFMLIVRVNYHVLQFCVWIQQHRHKQFMVGIQGLIIITIR